MENNEVFTINEFFPDVVNEIRESYQKSKKRLQDNKFSKSKIAQIYYATMRSSAGSLTTVAKLLSISPDKLKKYMEANPEASFAYRAALIDKRAELEESLTNILVDATVNGQVIREVKTEQVGFSIKTIKTKKQIPPNPQMALEILKRLNPETWGDKIKVDGKVEAVVNNYGLVGNVNIDVDYRKLSKETLRELINSQKETENNELRRREDGISVKYLLEAKNNSELKQEMDKPAKREKKWTDEQRRKILESRKKTEEIKKANKENKNNGE